jgi:hypothetical protein
MTAIEVIQAVRANGGHFIVDGDKLGITPADAAPPFANELRRLKPDILAELEREQVQGHSDTSRSQSEQAPSPEPEPWPEPEPLGSELPPVPAFDANLLPESLRPMVEDVAERMQVPLDFPAVAVVATLAGLCGRRAVIQPKAADASWTVVPNLWGAIVASPGTMKSPVISTITAPARAIEEEWRSEYENAMREHADAKVLADVQMNAWKQRATQACKKGESPTPPPTQDLDEPSPRRLITGDSTFESLHQLLAHNPGGVLVLRDEVSGWLAGLDRQGRESERAFYLECWSGDTGFTIDRIGRGSIHVAHCCVSFFGGFQPARMRAYMADALKDGPSNDGLIQRFQLLVWPDPRQDYKFVDRPANVGAIKAAETVYRRIASMDTENPLRLRFASDAQQLFNAWLTDVEIRMRADDMSPFMQAHLSKYRKLMPAVAVLFSLADGETHSVSLRHTQQAASLCDYLEAHARRVYSSRISPERLAAMSLTKKLTKGWKRKEGRFTIRDVERNDWSGLETPESVRAAVRVLENSGWLRRDQNKAERGRPSEAYIINPKVGGEHGVN